MQHRQYVGCKSLQLETHPANMLTAEVLVAVAGLASCAPANEEGATKAQAEPTRDAHTTAAAACKGHYKTLRVSIHISKGLKKRNESVACCELDTRTSSTVCCCTRIIYDCCSTRRGSRSGF
jgi:hypothetical protein